ncbi:hypothetical protein [Saccharopolyspora griseoalba]|uniref:Uncharacterized protein n=1 Tax=Saccharopolyspora griseoalba TaxID=1431848 RepID=A0ABW2LG33_9PSEU
MTLSENRTIPQDSLESDFEDVDLPGQTRHERVDEPEEDEAHLVRGYD